MRIGDRDLKRKPLIVAEIGNNHEGRFDIAKELVRKAAECGVDAVKFQTFRTEHYVSPVDRVRFERLKSFELSHSHFEQLSCLAHSLGLLFISTPFDLGSAAFLESIVDSYKISSGDSTFYPLLRQVAGTGKPVIISTGLSDIAQIETAIETVRQEWSERHIDGQLAILHCISCYPTPFDQVNLRVIRYMSERFRCSVGYSDHTLGIDACVLAFALGASIIEKHFTLDKMFSDFRDHQLSADPSEMMEMVERIKSAATMLGEPCKAVQACEEPSIGAIRRSIVASAAFARGHRIEWSDLTWVRPAGGLEPGQENLLVGKVLRRDVCSGELLMESDVE